MQAFNRKMFVNTWKRSTKRGQSKLSLGILHKTQKQICTQYRLLGVKVNQKKTSGGREELRQLISSLITLKAIPRQLICPRSLLGWPMPPMEKILSILQPESSDCTPREVRTLFFFTYDTIVYDIRSGHRSNVFAGGLGRNKMHNSWV